MKNQKKNLTVGIMSIAMASFVLSPVFAFADKGGRDQKSAEQVGQKMSQSQNVTLPPGIAKKIGDDKFQDKFKHFFEKWFKRGGMASSTPLTIGEVNKRVDTTTAIIGWRTNVNSTGGVYFAVGNSVATTTTPVSDMNLAKIHSVTLTGLTPNTLYSFVITSKDSAGNVKETKVFSFHTRPTMTPGMSLVIVSNTVSLLKATSTHIVITTDKPTKASLWVGTSTPVVITGTPVQINGTLSSSHDMTIGSLSTSTPYYYTVVVTDGSQNTATTTGTFTTLAL